MKKPFPWSRRPDALAFLLENYGKVRAVAIADYINRTYGANVSPDAVRSQAYSRGVGGGDNQGMPNIIEAAAEIGVNYQNVWFLVKRRGWRLHGRGHWRFVPPKVMGELKLFYSKPAGRRRVGIPQTLTIAEAAALWSVSRQRVEGAISDGRVRVTVKLGEIRIDVAEWERIGPRLPPKPKPVPVIRTRVEKKARQGYSGKPAANHPWRASFARVG